MAKVDNNGNWHGKLGDYVYYVRNGKQMRRSLPTPQKGPKTEGMKKNALNATEFGTAAMISKHLRNALEQECRLLEQPYLYQRLNALIIQVKNCDPAPFGSRTPQGGLETAEGKTLFNRFTFHHHCRKFPQLLTATLRGSQMEVVIKPFRTDIFLTELQINLMTGDFRRHDYPLTLADQKKQVIIKKKFRAKKGYTNFIFIAGKDSLQGIFLEKAEESLEKQAAEDSL